MRPPRNIPTAPTIKAELKVLNRAIHRWPLPDAGHRAWLMTLPVGLGDWVETWAKPIAKWIDRLRAKRPVVKTVLAWAGIVAADKKLAGCSACSNRRRLFNAWVPNIRSGRAWLGLFRAAGRGLKALVRGVLDAVLKSGTPKQ